MELSVEHVGPVIVAKLCFESLTVNNAQDFRSEITNLLTPGARVVLDMSNLAFIDSSGIGALIGCISKARSLKGDVRISSVTRPVQNLLELVRADRFVQVFDLVDQAVSSFAGTEDVA